MPLNRLGMLLKKAGYTQKCLSGKTGGWLVRERGLEEVNANRNINTIILKYFVNKKGKIFPRC